MYSSDRNIRTFPVVTPNLNHMASDAEHTVKWD